MTMKSKEPAPPVPTTESSSKTVEEWATEKKTSDFDLAGARVLAAWGIGSIVTEAAFDAAVSRFRGNTCGH